MTLPTATDGRRRGGGTGPALVEARGLYRFFHTGDEETAALREVSLALQAGELAALVGPSGSGKSTLLACLAGLDDPDAGTVTVAGQRISRIGEAARTRLRARTIGVLLQSSNLIEHLTVAANVALAQSLAGHRGATAGSARAHVLSRLGLAGRASAYPSSLSGGEAARAGLAVAVAGAPAVLLADEPTGELDRATAAEVLGLLGEQAATGTAVLVATHDAAVTAAADRVAAHAGRAAAMTGPALVRCEEATVRHHRRAGSVTALRAVSCAVLPGQRILVHGPSGSGKTTLLHLLGGLQPAAGGTVSWPALGAAPSRRPDLIGIALQGPSLLPPLDVTENVMLPLLLSGVPEKIARRQAASLLATFDLSAAGSTLPEELSGGQASRVGLVRALAARPRLILADEPTGQLDTATAANVMALLADAATACGAALVVATHDPAVAARLPLRWRLDDGVLHTCPAADR